ncbi:putative hydrolase [Candidatus Cyrtobacter comes]|uniref:Hydrolase n=1 Tax=Candidatus Cyrtobacter comes TaxID=675776 RepID=A0ABU5L735_9RICK|nr:hypothetical protein [Candidatus Cyrtobacter comes]MDZ5761936.1 putative hydrolase [Candidatus Cyrtobacter comes]
MILRILALLLFITSDLYAFCKPTKQLWSLDTPEDPQNSSELSRARGSPSFFNGTRITLRGGILDEMCVPIEGATVQIWQTTITDLEDQGFVPNGTSITDNKGRYVFDTILPSTRANGILPKMRIKVSHKDFFPVETVTFFVMNDIKSDDEDWSSLSLSEKRELICKCLNCDRVLRADEILEYRFDIIMDGRLKFRS